MHITVPMRGAQVICLRLLLLLAVLFGMFTFILSIKITLLCFIITAIICTPLCYWHMRSCTLHMGTHHLTVRRGILFTSTKRLSSQFITGSYIIQFPFARLTNTCTLLLFSSGCLSFIDGIALRDAQTLCAQLSPDAQEAL